MLDSENIFFQKPHREKKICRLFLNNYNTFPYCFLYIENHGREGNSLLTNKKSSDHLGSPVVMYGCESWTVKKAECRRIDAFEMWCWPGLPVHHQLPEFTQTHAHRGSDAIQPSHPLSSPSPPALNPSQHQSLFQ